MPSEQGFEVRFLKNHVLTEFHCKVNYFLALFWHMAVCRTLFEVWDELTHLWLEKTFVEVGQGVLEQAQVSA